LNGEIVARLVVTKPEHEERLAKMGVKDPKRIYGTEDLATRQENDFRVHRRDRWEFITRRPILR